KICPAAVAFRDLGEHALLDPVIKFVADADGIDDRFGSLRSLDGIVKLLTAERIVAIGEQNDRSPRLVRCRPEHLFRRDPDRIPDRRRARDSLITAGDRRGYGNAATAVCYDSTAEINGWRHELYTVDCYPMHGQFIC